MMILLLELKNNIDAFILPLCLSRSLVRAFVVANINDGQGIWYVKIDKLRFDDLFELFLWLNINQSWLSDWLIEKEKDDHNDRAWTLSLPLFLSSSMNLGICLIKSVHSIIQSELHSSNNDSLFIHMFVDVQGWPSTIWLFHQNESDEISRRKWILLFEQQISLSSLFGDW